MATILLELLFKSKRTNPKKRKNSGFTLLELLVAVLIATFVIIALLNLVVDLLQTDRREYARNETQREMQMALDYMVNDVREAAYVYDKTGLDQVSNYLGFPGELKPVFAFWKPETISDTELASLGDCSQYSDTDTKKVECQQLVVRRRAYSLVVYLQKVNEGEDKKIWKGVSRVMRFQLNRYKRGEAGNLQTNTGYVAPNENNVSFLSWPKKNDGNTAPGNDSVDKSNIPVLVDFVDYPYKNGDSRPDNLKPPADPTCPDTSYSAIPEPGKDSKFNNPSFMVCVSTGAVGVTSSNYTNQDVFIFIRGNPTGKAGVKVAPLLALRTQAVARGVIDKNPQQQ